MKKTTIPIEDEEKCMSAIENACSKENGKLTLDKDCALDLKLNAWGQFIVQNLHWEKNGKAYKPFLEIKCGVSYPIAYLYVVGSIDNEGFSSGDITMFKKEYRI